MSEHRNLRITSDATSATVELDGHQIQDGLSALTLRMAVGQLPEVELTPLVVTGSFDYEGTIRAVVLPDTHRTLVQLGWTPPPDDPAGGE